MDGLTLAIHHAGGEIYLVGGAVRDMVMGRTDSKDRDYEVFGLTVDELDAVLSRSGDVKRVGKSFGVLTMNGDDYSIPGVEIKAGDGHKGAVRELNPHISLVEACARRDFTMNAIMIRLSDNELIDPYGGVSDIANKILRHTSPLFVQDPLRVLRGFQFVSRFGLKAHVTTAKVCRSLLHEYGTLSKDRVWIEWKKWAGGEYPSLGILYLLETYWLGLYDELAGILFLDQDKEHHPEGSVFEHTLHTVAAADHIARRDLLDEEERLDIMFAALLHDVGKAMTTETVDGKIRAYAHEKVGASMAESFLMSIGSPLGIRSRVATLVREHMIRFKMKSPSPRGVRRLSRRLHEGGVNIHNLMNVIEADCSGRPPKPAGLPEGFPDILAIAHGLGVADAAPERILMGRHLIGIIDPGPQMGALLDWAYELQLDGAFMTVAEALALVARVI